MKNISILTCLRSLGSATLFTLTLLFSGVVYAQEAIDSTKYDAYKSFIGQILTSNNTGLTPSFSLSVAENPSLSLALPLYPLVGAFKARNPYTHRFTLQEDRARMTRQRFFLFLNGKLSAQEGITALFNDGKWKPDAEAGIAVTFLLNRIVRFYSAETRPFVNIETNPYGLSFIKPIADMPLTDASQILFTWINASVGYKRSSFTLFDTVHHKMPSAQFDSAANGVYAGANFNLYCFPSKFRTPRFTFYMQVGVLYKQRDNNYNNDEVEKIKGTIPSSNVYNGVTINTTKDVNARWITNFKLYHSVNIPAQMIFLIHSLDHKFYFGLGTHYNQKITGDKKSSADLGLSVNLPVVTGKNSDTKANFQLMFNWADVRNNLQGSEVSRKDYRKKNFDISFTASVPILISHKQPADKK